MSILHINQHKEIPFIRIAYLESDLNYTNVYTVSETKVLSSYTIGVLYKRLDQKLFYRANRKLVFNLSFVDELWYEGEYVYLNLRSGKHIVFSRRRSRSFKKFMKANYKYKIAYRYPNKRSSAVYLNRTTEFAFAMQN